MDAIKDILVDLMQGLTTRKPSQDDPAILFKKAFSKKELGHVKFKYLRKGILGINVDSSSRIYHLNLQKELLLTKMRKNLGNIKDVRFYIGVTQ